MFGVTGAAPSAYSVTAVTRNRWSAVSALRSLACACSSCAPRMPVSCVRLSRFRSAAAATKRDATAFTVPVTPAASGPVSSSRRKFPSISELTLSSRRSRVAASAGVVTVNSTTCPARSTPSGGTHAKPSAAPIESPTAPRSSTAPASSVSVKPVPTVSTARRYVPGRTRSLIAKLVSAAESPETFTR